MWMMPLHLHVNQKSDYDYDDLLLECCLYVFRIGNDWRFEDDLFDFYGCQVLAFDPRYQ